MVTEVLFLDSGNTRLKYQFAGVFGIFSSLTDLDLFLKKQSPSYISYALVSEHEAELIQIFQTNHCAYGKAIVKDHCLGLSLRYPDPDSLGVDRWLAMLAAINYYPNTPLIVVNAGTALTIDCITASGDHQGGSISPGYRMAVQALNQNTANLPIIAANIVTGMGIDTASCINYGVTHSMVALIEKTAQIFNRTATVLITGGDAQFLADHLVTNNQVMTDLVLKGLELYYQNSIKHGIIS